MDPQLAWVFIRKACEGHPKWVYPQWRDRVDRLGGFCQIATMTFCHFVDGAVPHRMYHHERGGAWEHYYAVRGDEVWDLTVDQFDEPLAYDGKEVPFRLTERVKRCIKEVEWITVNSQRKDSTPSGEIVLTLLP
jgi:hypothetical protein